MSGKTCIRCKETKPFDGFAKDLSRPDGKHPYCRECKSVDGKRYHRDNAEKRRIAGIAWRAKSKGTAKYAVMQKTSSKKYRAALRTRVLRAYGGEMPTCACCGESIVEFLAIDHIHGGGNAHRRSIGSNCGASIYKWLERNGFPAGFQVLCHNCNFAKSKHGMCPHLRMRAEVA